MQANNSGYLEEAGFHRTVHNQIHILSSEGCVTRLDAYPIQIGPILGEIHKAIYILCNLK
jgi:hypothetical protein